jgi:hypothetical protein
MKIITPISEDMLAIIDKLVNIKDMFVIALFDLLIDLRILFGCSKSFIPSFWFKNDD